MCEERKQCLQLLMCHGKIPGKYIDRDFPLYYNEFVLEDSSQFLSYIIIIVAEGRERNRPGFRGFCF